MAWGCYDLSGLERPQLDWRRLFIYLFSTARAAGFCTSFGLWEGVDSGHLPHLLHPLLGVLLNRTNQNPANQQLLSAQSCMPGTQAGTQNPSVGADRAHVQM